MEKKGKLEKKIKKIVNVSAISPISLNNATFLELSDNFFSRMLVFYEKFEYTINNDNHFQLEDDVNVLEGA